MTTPDVVTVRTAPGWWPNLVTLDCSRCGSSWTVDLNAARWTAAAFLRQQVGQHEQSCDA